MTFIKFCGLTREDDVALACELGVDAVGFVLWPNSPRAADVSRLVGMVRLLPPRVAAVGVFVSPTIDEVRRACDAGVQVVQVHAADSAAVGTLAAAGARELWVAQSLDGDFAALASDTIVVLDAHDPVRHGGTGRTIDWERAAGIAAARRVLLAGGLTAANVRDAIDRVRPFGVDVASGIEHRPGIKDARAMRAFVAAVREADQ